MGGRKTPASSRDPSAHPHGRNCLRRAFRRGGAVLLAHQPPRAIVGDANAELINVYEVVRDQPADLIRTLREHKSQHSASHFYAVRALDRDPSFHRLSPVERAGRFMYLNKTCYNGLYRVNAAGQLNSPFGRYKNPKIVPESDIWALSDYLKSSVTLTCGDYATLLTSLPEGAFVYLDPPYMPVSASASFTGYTQGGFDYTEQVRLRDQCLQLQARGIRFIQSNSDTPAIRELYAAFEIRPVQARRSINSQATLRGNVGEVLIIG